MIKLVVQTFSGPPLLISLDNSHNMPAVNGAVRWNGTSKNFEVCDNYGTWLRIENTVQIQTSSEVEELLGWAKKKKNEEARYAELAQSNPTIKDLLKTIEEAKQQIEMVKILTQ